MAAMGMTRITRRIVAWTACLAVLLAASAPSVSLALAAAKGSNALWIEVCSVQGATLVKADGKQSSTSPTPVKTMYAEHCPFCCTHAGSVSLPPAAAFHLHPLLSGTPTRPALYHQSPYPLFVWTAPQSRAPPVLS